MSILATFGSGRRVAAIESSAALHLQLMPELCVDNDFLNLVLSHISGRLEINGRPWSQLSKSQQELVETENNYYIPQELAFGVLQSYISPTQSREPIVEENTQWQCDQAQNLRSHTLALIQQHSLHLLDASSRDEITTNFKILFQNSYYCAITLGLAHYPPDQLFTEDGAKLASEVAIQLAQHLNGTDCGDNSLGTVQCAWELALAQSQDRAQLQRHIQAMLARYTEKMKETAELLDCLQVGRDAQGMIHNWPTFCQLAYRIAKTNCVYALYLVQEQWIELFFKSPCNPKKFNIGHDQEGSNAFMGVGQTCLQR